MSTEMTQVPGAAAAQTPANQQPQAAQPTAGQPTAEQPKTDTNPTTAAQPATQQAPTTLTAPAEPAPVEETSWLEDETMGLSNRTWCEIIGTIAVAATGYFVGQYMANKDSSTEPSV